MKVLFPEEHGITSKIAAACGRHDVSGQLTPRAEKIFS
jgi:hypothetical protein